MEAVDSLEAIVAILDQGYCDMALSEACTCLEESCKNFRLTQQNPEKIPVVSSLVKRWPIYITGAYIKAKLTQTWIKLNNLTLQP